MAPAWGSRSSGEGVVGGGAREGVEDALGAEAVQELGDQGQLTRPWPGHEAGRAAPDRRGAQVDALMPVSIILATPPRRTSSSRGQPAREARATRVRIGAADGDLAGAEIGDGGGAQADGARGDGEVGDATTEQRNVGEPIHSSHASFAQSV